MRRVLMLSPHFPPDTSAGAHRVRLLAPHLSSHGWEPTVLSVDPRRYEGRLDHSLSELVPGTLRVIRCDAWPARWTRRLGVGDLGLRAFRGLWRGAAALLREERFDAVFITIYPTYPALLGPLIKRRFRVPFVIDYQDPWVGAWGESVGGGPGGQPDLKSRLSRAAALRLEPIAIRAADAVTAVSSGTVDDLRRRFPSLHRTPCLVLPLGAEVADLEPLGRRPGRNPYFDPADGLVHLCYVGTVLPKGGETLRAVLAGAARVRDERPELYRRLRLHFFGTSNQTAPDAAPRVLPVARDLGVVDSVSEIAPRIDYLDALRVQGEASAIVLLGSSEPHYTASKLFPGLLAARPILAVQHEASSAVEMLGRALRPPAVRIVTYDDTRRAGSRVDAISAALRDLLERPPAPAHPDPEVMQSLSARAMAGRLAGLLDRLRSRG